VQKIIHGLKDSALCLTALVPYSDMSTSLNHKLGMHHLAFIDNQRKCWALGNHLVGHKYPGCGTESINNS
jgi:hypothetical protein